MSDSSLENENDLQIYTGQFLRVLLMQQFIKFLYSSCVHKYHVNITAVLHDKTSIKQT